MTLAILLNFIFSLHVLMVMALAVRLNFIPGLHVMALVDFLYFITNLDIFMALVVFLYFIPGLHIIALIVFLNFITSLDIFMVRSVFFLSITYPYITLVSVLYLSVVTFWCSLLVRGQFNCSGCFLHGSYEGYLQKKFNYFVHLKQKIELF